jgi:phosphohistidine phosphatase
MLHTLYIVRHAQAVSGNHEWPDELRPLTPKGERDARQLGVHLKSQNSNLNLIISSPAVRAHSTAQLLAESLAARASIQVDRTLYSGNKLTLLQRLNALPEPQPEVMLVGHYPTIVELHDYLSANNPVGGMQAGELIALTVATSWRELTGGLATPLYSFSP